MKRRTPKPGIPHFKIKFTRYSKRPYLVAMNSEAEYSLMLYDKTGDDHLNLHSEVLHVMKGRKHGRDIRSIYNSN